MEKEFRTIAADFIDAYCRTSHEKFLDRTCEVYNDSGRTHTKTD